MKRHYIGMAMIAASVLVTMMLMGCEAPAVEAETAAAVKDAAKPAAKTVKRRRGFAAVEVQRPARFPHRIWAACGFETKLPSYGWFGKAETKNLAKYPGNATARAATPYGRTPGAIVTGINPVPGPMMGKVNYMYCRYFITGADRAIFQHYSLTRNDNNNVTVSGLTQGKWSEVTMNFTRDARRNDGSKEAFKKGERMDDLKVFIRPAAEGKKVEFVIDDVIFFSEDPALPPEAEPFPNRVMFVAAFDTGIRPEATKQKFFPGEFAIPKSGPQGSHWAVAEAVPIPGADKSCVLLKLTPPRTVGQETKLRVRCWLKGAEKMKIVLHDATAMAGRLVELKGLPQGKWVTKYVNFTKDSIGGGKLSAGNKVDSLAFVVDGAGEKVKLYVDEIVLYDAGKPVKLAKGKPALP